MLTRVLQNLLFSYSNHRFAKIQQILIPGFSRGHKFISPDYSERKTADEDFRSTVFWEPDLAVDATPEPAQISFFAGDLPGYYRVVVDGVTAGNKPIRGELFLEIRQ